MARTTCAAAIPEGAVVTVHGESFTVDHIENSTPEPGRITWYDDDGNTAVVGGAEEVEIVHLPKVPEPSDRRR